MKSFSQKKELFYKWYKKNEDKLKDVPSIRVFEVFNKVHPGLYQESSLSKVVLQIRHGKLTDDSFKKELDIEVEPIPLIEDLTEAEPNFNTGFFESNMIELPTSWAESYVPFEITGVKNIGICGDIHLPYHDEIALAACFSEFKKRGVDGIYLNGDIMDYEKISRFGTMPDGRYLKDEIEVGRAFVKALRRMFPRIPIYFKAGNHEKRLETYIISKCPELANLYGMDTPSLLGLPELNIQYIPENIVSKFGKLWICHGHELNMGSGSVNVARQVRLRVGVSSIVNHWHRATHDQSRNLADESHAVWSLGCLCYLKPRYTGALNQWSHGAATAELLSEDGKFRVNPFQIDNGRVY